MLAFFFNFLAIPTTWPVGILVLLPGIELLPFALEGRILNHLTTLCSVYLHFSQFTNFVSGISF